MHVDPPLGESFTRLFSVHEVERGSVGQFAAALGALRVEGLGREGERHPLWSPLDPGQEESLTRFLLPSVREYLDVGGRGSGHGSVRSWSLHPELRSRISRLRTEEFHFDLEEVHLTLFSTGILVVVLQVALRGRVGASVAPTLGDLVKFNYRLRAPGRGQAARVQLQAPPLPGHLSPEARAAAEAPRWWHRYLPAEGLGIPELLERLLPHPSRTSSRDEGAFRLQTFARVPAGTPITSLREPFHHLRRVVKRSYRPAPGELVLRGNPEVIRSWGNVLLGMSLEGMAMLVVDTDHPFTRQLSERARTSYSTLYLLGIHQRAACLGLLGSAARIPPLGGGGVERGQVEEVQALRRRVVNFTLHHRHNQVSTQTVYARLYERLMETLHVPVLLDEVRDEVAELDAVLRMARDEARALRDRRISHLAAAFTVVAILLGLLGSNLAPYSPETTRALGVAFYGTPAFLVPALGAAAVLVALLVNYLRGR